MIPHNLSLEGAQIILLPLTAEHLDSLVQVGNNERTWQFFSFNGSHAPRLRQHLEECLEEMRQGRRHTFMVKHKGGDYFMGCTSFYELNERFRNLEIGYTWYHPDYWGYGYNDEAKALMLRYAFEDLKLLRVQFKAWEKNRRSCQAIERIGGRLEGYVRNHMIREDGTIRTSALYSILQEEWPYCRVNDARYFLQG
jgi:RimJ/RimL family protein N-acetyltransferase